MRLMFVARLMVVGVKPKAGDGLGNDSAPGETVVIGPLEEILFGMRIGNQVGAVACEFGAQIAALETGKP